MSLFVITGDKKKDESNERDLHLHYEAEPYTYPFVYKNRKETMDKGYEKYRDLIDESQDTVSYESWLHRFDKICIDIDACIRQYHGVKCYEDGDKSNNEVNNIMILHICDVLNMMVAFRRNEIPTVVIKTRLLENICTEIVNDFQLQYTDTYDMIFFWKNVDFVYTCYAYLGNYSFVPIRTLVKKDDTTFKESVFFTNDDHFVKHQKGKLQEFNQNENKVVSKLVYRSI